MESADRASGYFTTRAETRPRSNARTAGVYWRADPEDMSILDGHDDRQRAELITERLEIDHEHLRPPTRRVVRSQDVRFNAVGAPHNDAQSSLILTLSLTLQIPSPS